MERKMTEYRRLWATQNPESAARSRTVVCYGTPPVAHTYDHRAPCLLYQPCDFERRFRARGDVRCPLVGTFEKLKKLRSSTFLKASRHRALAIRHLELPVMRTDDTSREPGFARDAGKKNVTMLISTPTLLPVIPNGMRTPRKSSADRPAIHSQDIIVDTQASDYVPELLPRRYRKDLKPLNGNLKGRHIPGYESLVEWQKRGDSALASIPSHGFHSFMMFGAVMGRSAYTAWLSVLCHKYADSRPSIPRVSRPLIPRRKWWKHARIICLMGARRVSSSNFDAFVTKAADGTAKKLPNAICLHEEDNGNRPETLHWRTGRAADPQPELIVQFYHRWPTTSAAVFAYKARPCRWHHRGVARNWHPERVNIIRNTATWPRSPQTILLATQLSSSRPQLDPAKRAQFAAPCSADQVPRLGAVRRTGTHSQKSAEDWREHRRGSRGDSVDDNGRGGGSRSNANLRVEDWLQINECKRRKLVSQRDPIWCTMRDDIEYSSTSTFRTVDYQIENARCTRRRLLATLTGWSAGTCVPVAVEQDWFFRSVYIVKRYMAEQEQEECSRELEMGQPAIPVHLRTGTEKWSSENVARHPGLRHMTPIFLSQGDSITPYQDPPIKHIHD
ncbi:uncharacterized protein ATNIH1004_001970 [Aspergillus tanneri]|uniref:Uncharacterized protein n=1 Tax=Aspergillus tanneri TaxID=1220188 RepID=A0A5M9M3P3_9EURO|nr:uncharacterized protein ATNIH1004_001970 [Aspergillus tanneri]KAA8641368.1 hypothetical protein ATNIH1004_001970 [Aspergillus tanneri]